MGKSRHADYISEGSQVISDANEKIYDDENSNDNVDEDE